MPEIGLVLSSLYLISHKRMFPVMGIMARVVGAAIALAGGRKLNAASDESPVTKASVQRR